jgi:dTDP-L-rhamnose 4-epimerase
MYKPAQSMAMHLSLTLEPFNLGVSSTEHSDGLAFTLRTNPSMTSTSSTLGHCLITGGAGFIGCAVSKRLARHFETVTAVDNFHPQVHQLRERPALLHQSVRLIEGDVTSRETWRAVLSECHPDVILHLAAETGTAQSMDEASRHAEVNVIGLTRMLDGLRSMNIVPKNILLTSSRAVYGEGMWIDTSSRQSFCPGQRSISQLNQGLWDFPNSRPQPFSKAHTAPRPTSVYGATKLAQESILQAWAASSGSAATTLRLQNVYGPGQSLSNPYTGILPLFAQIARKGQSIPLYEDGRMQRDFVHIDDVASAIECAAINSRAHNQTLDVGSGLTTEIREVAHLIASYYRAPDPHVCGKYRLGDVRHASCRIEDTTNLIGWTPKVSIQSGVASLLKWIDEVLIESREVAA